MDRTSLRAMRSFRDRYVDQGKQTSVLDIGSFDVNGAYRDLFPRPLFDYVGLDITPGPNVDVVSSEYGFHDALNGRQFDVVISGSCIEHVFDVARWAQEAAKVIKLGGMACWVVPSAWPEHRYPVDCWRLMPDGMKWLMECKAELKIIEVYKVNCIRRRMVPAGVTVGIGRKPA